MSKASPIHLSFQRRKTAQHQTSSGSNQGSNGGSWGVVEAKVQVGYQFHSVFSAENWHRLAQHFWNIHETFPHIFSKQAKLRQSHRAETADFRFQISNFEIRQIAFLMTCRPQKSTRWLWRSKTCTKLILNFPKWFDMSNQTNWANQIFR